MKKYYDSLIHDIIKGDLAFNVVKEHIDDYRTFILDRLYDESDSYIFVKIDKKHQDELIEKIYKEYSDVIVFKDIEEGLFITTRGYITFEFDSHGVSILNDGDCILDMTICNESSFKNFIENLKIAHHKAPQVYFSNEYCFNKIYYKDFYDALPNEDKLLIEVEYPEISCSDDEVRSCVLQKLGDKFSEHEIELIKKYLR